MAVPKIRPTGVERSFGVDEIIVSKTDLRGRITYANEVFCRVSGYSEAELLHQAHNIVRHPAMPRCVFQLLWDTIQSGREIFAYVVNLAKNGDHYWVLAHVTPSYDARGTMCGYHSNRRVPERGAVQKVQAIYESLCQTERGHRVPKNAIAASMPRMASLLQSVGMTYDEFVFSLIEKDLVAQEARA